MARGQHKPGRFRGIQLCQGIVGQGPGKEFGEDWSWWAWMGAWRRGTYSLYSQIP